MFTPVGVRSIGSEPQSVVVLISGPPEPAVPEEPVISGSCEQNGLSAAHWRFSSIVPTVAGADAPAALEAGAARIGGCAGLAAEHAVSMIEASKLL